MCVQIKWSVWQRALLKTAENISLIQRFDGVKVRISNLLCISFFVRSLLYWSAVLCFGGGWKFRIECGVSGLTMDGAKPASRPAWNERNDVGARQVSIERSLESRYFFREIYKNFHIWSLYKPSDQSNPLTSCQYWMCYWSLSTFTVLREIHKATFCLQNGGKSVCLLA